MVSNRAQIIDVLAKHSSDNAWVRTLFEDVFSHDTGIVETTQTELQTTQVVVARLTALLLSKGLITDDECASLFDRADLP